MKFDTTRVFKGDVWYREMGDRLITLKVLGVNEQLVFVRRSSGLKAESTNKRRRNLTVLAHTITGMYQLYSRTNEDERLASASTRNQGPS